MILLMRSVMQNVLNYKKNTTTYVILFGMKSLCNTQNKSELKVLLTNYNLVSEKPQNTHTEKWSV